MEVHEPLFRCVLFFLNLVSLVCFMFVMKVACSDEYISTFPQMQVPSLADIKVHRRLWPELSGLICL